MTAGALALGSIFTVLGVLAPILYAGVGLIVAAFSGLYAVLGVLFSPIVLIIVALDLLGRAAYDIYKHWGNTGHFFHDLWEGVKGTFTDFVSWVDGWTGGFGTRMLTGIKAGWQALLDGIDALIKGLQPHFDLDLHIPFGPDSVIGKLLGLHDLPQLQTPAGGGPQGAATQSAGPAQVGGRIVVEAAPGTTIRSTESTNATVPLVAEQTNLGRVTQRR